MPKIPYIIQSILSTSIHLEYSKSPSIHYLFSFFQPTIAHKFSVRTFPHKKKFSIKSQKKILISYRIQFRSIFIENKTFHFFWSIFEILNPFLCCAIFYDILRVYERNSLLQQRIMWNCESPVRKKDEMCDKLECNIKRLKRILWNCKVLLSRQVMDWSERNCKKLKEKFVEIVRNYGNITQDNNKFKQKLTKIVRFKNNFDHIS